MQLGYTFSFPEKKQTTTSYSRTGERPIRTQAVWKGIIRTLVLSSYKNIYRKDIWSGVVSEGQTVASQRQTCTTVRNLSVPRCFEGEASMEMF